MVTTIEERRAASRWRGFRERFAGRELQPGSERDFALRLLSSFAPMGMAPMGGAGPMALGAGAAGPGLGWGVGGGAMGMGGAAGSMGASAAGRRAGDGRPRTDGRRVRDRPVQHDAGLRPAVELGVRAEPGEPRRHPVRCGAAARGRTSTPSRTRCCSTGTCGRRCSGPTGRAAR